MKLREEQCRKQRFSENRKFWKHWFFTQQEAGAKIEKQQEQMKYAITNVKNPWITQQA